MSILGNRVLRREDPKFLTVGGTYVADLPARDSVHVTFVRSSMAHANIVSVDRRVRSPWRASSPSTPTTTSHREVPDDHGHDERSKAPPMLAAGTVRFVGEPIAVIVATSREIAGTPWNRWFEYEPLPVVIDPAMARTDENLLFPMRGRIPPFPWTSVATTRSSTRARSWWS